MLDTYPSTSPPVVLVRQSAPLGESKVERGLAVRALVGACLYGALEHYGQGDHRVNGTTRPEDVRLADLRRVVVGKGDKGLHGCGFEYAVHEAVNGALGIPEAVRSCVSSVVSVEVGALYERLGVPFIRWTPAVRSVMFAVEKQHGDPERLKVRGQLGDGALIWAAAGKDPYLLGALLPLATLSARSHLLAGRAHDRHANPNLPEGLSHLWRADLFLGGAVVESTRAVAGLVGDKIPTAWVSATVKYTARQVVGGPGLHLGLQSGHLPWGQDRGLVVDRSRRDGLTVLTLPLDGEFVLAFNRAWRTLVTAMWRGLARRAHPAYVGPGDRALVEELGMRRADFVVDIADDLLHTGQAGIATRVVQHASSASAAGGRTPLVAPVPQVLPTVS